MISRRRPLAWLLLVALLFAQIANAAYACALDPSMPGERSAFDREIGSTRMTAIEASSKSMADCEKMKAIPADHDLTASPLCMEHCTHATQATADVHVPVPHWLPAVLLGVFLVVPAIDHSIHAPALAKAPGAERSIAPAIPILLGRFLS